MSKYSYRVPDEFVIRMKKTSVIRGCPNPAGHNKIVQNLKKYLSVTDSKRIKLDTSKNGQNFD